MARRKIEKNEPHTKDHILQSAVKLFAKEGYDGLKMDTLASFAKVNKATIYYYYKNKQTLYETIIENVAKSYYQNMQKYLLNKNDPKEKLDAFIDSALVFIETNRDIAKIMMIELSCEWKNIDGKVKENFIPIILAIKNLLQEGVDKGVFNKINPLLLQGLLMGGFNYYLLMKNIYVGFESASKLNIKLSDGKQEIKQMILKSLIKDVK